MAEVKTPARVVATVLTVDAGDVIAALILTEDGESQYAVQENSATAGWLHGVLDACGVQAWEQLPGRTVYALRPDGDGPVLGLEALPTEPGGRFVFPEIGAYEDTAEVQT